MTRAIPIVIYLVLLGLAFHLGRSWDGMMLFLFRGRAQMFVTTADIPIGGEPAPWQEGISSSSLGNRPVLGGIKAGTPVEVRHIGPINTVTIQFEVLGIQPPLRAVSVEEGERLRRQLLRR